MGTDSVLETLIGHCPQVEVSINGVALKAMVDSGALVSTITEQLYNCYFRV